MFARRKRRPRDEEPLVPHGLIWQATEETMPPSSAQPDPHDSAKPIEMPKFRWSAPPADPTVRRAPASVPANDNRVRPLPKKQESKSSSLPSLPRVQELNKRRMLLQEEREQRKPSTLQAESVAAQAEYVTAETCPVHEPQQVMAQETSVSELAAITTVKEPHTPAPLKLRSQHFLRKTRTQLRQTYQVLTSAWQRVSQRTAKVAVGMTGLSKRIQSASNTAIRATKIRLANRVPKASSTASELQIVKPTVPSVTSRPTTPALRTSVRLRLLTVTRSAQQFWERKVLIRVRAGKQFRNVILKFESTRAQTTAALHKNERLASSMLMAGLSALLALGLVLVVKRYEPVNAMKSMQRPAAADVNSSAVTTKPAVVDVEGVAVAKPVVAQPIVETSLATPMATTKPTAQKAVTRKATSRRTRQGTDDDYVAPDTYVYYGHR